MADVYWRCCDNASIGIVVRKQDEDTLPRQFMAFLSCQQLSEPSFSYRGLVTTGNKPRKDQVIWFISIPVLMPIYFFTPLPNASWLIRLRQREVRTWSDPRFCFCLLSAPAACLRFKGAALPADIPFLPGHAATFLANYQ